MMLNKQIRFFLKYFFHKRVFTFILIGTGVIFLTFLTKNNALEIAISGIASVFIGIGVNNLSSLETRNKDEKEMNLKIEHALKVIQIVNSKIIRMKEEANAGNYQHIGFELEELEQFIDLGIRLIRKV